MALARGLQVVGDQWSLLIVQAAFQRVRRYGAFRDRLGVSDAVLAGRLADLVGDRILEVSDANVDGRGGDYGLTEIGRDLWTVFVAAWWWAQRWDPTTASRVALVHRNCGRSPTPSLGCGTCGARQVGLGDVTATPGAGSTIDKTNPARRYRRATVVDEGATHLPPELVGILGDRWSLSVLAAALLGARRFGDFETMIGINPNVLSDRLQRFVEASVLGHEAMEDGGRRRQYRVLNKALDIVPLLYFVNAWAERWYGDIDHPDLVVEHGNHRFEPSWWCDHCEQRLRRAEVHLYERSASRTI